MLKESVVMFRSLFSKKDNRAMVEGELFKILMAVLLLAVLILGVGILTGKGAAVLSSIKNFLRFGR